MSNILAVAAAWAAINVPVGILATNQIIEIWRHSSLPFVVRRRAAWQAQPPDTFRGAWSRCMWCASVPAGVAVFVLLWTPLAPIIFGLAISRGANLLNDLAKPSLRTPSDEQDQTE